ncbi:hypothetical protein HYV49_05060 [Candidatus Pacearchaeota archaeon]|nr:hypothetical protein [Candidatus Pacearchaeota archaeon]
MTYDPLKELIVKKAIAIEDNRIKLFHTIDYTLYPGRALAIILQQLGKKGGKKYLFGLGSIMGNDAIDEMEEYLKKVEKFVPDRIKTLQPILEISGFAKFDTIEYKDKDIIFKLTKHPVIDFGVKLFGKDSMVCEFYRAVFSAFCRKLLKSKNYELVENKCIRKGDPYCEWSYKNG